MTSTIPDHPSEPRKLPTPGEMIEYLNRFVHGQEHAKRALTVAVYNHLLAQACQSEDEDAFEDFGKQHVLLIGPTGTGKTYLVKMLARMLGVPVGFASATSLVQTGYVGDPVDSIVHRLAARANYDPYLAERGFVFIDEIDKVRRSHGHGPDVSGEGVQRGLLTLLDGREVQVNRKGAPGITVNTSRILFVAAGAFVGLEKIIENRLGYHHIGFSTPSDTPRDRPREEGYELLDDVESVDLEQFGFIPELIGRFSTFSAVKPLNPKDLIKILADTENSILKKQHRLFELHGIELVFTPESLDAIADVALEMGTGARGLTRTVLAALDHVDYRPYELRRSGVEKVIISDRVITEGAAPEFIYAQDPTDGELPADELRERALLPKMPHPGSVEQLPAGTSSRADWPAERVSREIDETKNCLDWDRTTGSARKWWVAFEKANAHRPLLVLSLAEELKRRTATITEFFLAVVYSETNKLQANLHYLDYMRVKNLEAAERAEEFARDNSSDNSKDK